jgi:hypothetical protein
MPNLKNLSELRCPDCGSSTLAAKKNEDTHRFEITCQGCNSHFEPDEAATSEKDFQKKKQENAQQKRWIKSIVSLIVVVAIAMAYMTYRQIKEGV